MINPNAVKTFTKVIKYGGLAIVTGDFMAKTIDTLVLEIEAKDKGTIFIDKTKVHLSIYALLIYTKVRSML